MTPTYAKHFVVCPWCMGESGNRIDHLYEDKFCRWGPWYCDLCGKPFEGSVSETNEVTCAMVKDDGKRFIRCLALLRLEGQVGPIFFVMDHKRYADEFGDSSLEFFFEEHSCPTNWIGECVAIVDTSNEFSRFDPHGFLKFVRSVDITVQFESDDEESIAALFPELYAH